MVALGQDLVWFGQSLIPPTFLPCSLRPRIRSEEGGSAQWYICPPIAKYLWSRGIPWDNGKAVALSSSGESSDKWALLWTPNRNPTQPLEGDSVVPPPQQVAYDVRQETISKLHFWISPRLTIEYLFLAYCSSCQSWGFQAKLCSGSHLFSQADSNVSKFNTKWLLSGIPKAWDLDLSCF